LTDTLVAQDGEARRPSRQDPPELAALPAGVRDHLGLQLRVAYEAVTRAQTPPRLLELVAQLDAALEGPQRDYAAVFRDGLTEALPGLRAFALGLRQDLAPDGIGVSVVNPGFIREAGMFHESGRTPPPGLGTATPEQVGEAVARAIEDDRAELDVAPVQQRLLANFAGRRPHLAARITRGRL